MRSAQLSLFFEILGFALFVFWLAFDLPIGPGSPLQYIPTPAAGG